MDIRTALPILALSATIAVQQMEISALQKTTTEEFSAIKNLAEVTSNNAQSIENVSQGVVALSRTCETITQILKGMNVRIDLKHTGFEVREIQRDIDAYRVMRGEKEKRIWP